MLKEDTLVIVRAAPKKFYENLKLIHPDYIPPLEWRKSTLTNSKRHQKTAKIEN